MFGLGLAIVHHLLVFGLVAMLASDRTLSKAPTIDVKRLVRLDGGHGLTAVLIVAVGLARVVWGGKGWAYYGQPPELLLILPLVALAAAMARWPF